MWKKTRRIVRRLSHSPRANAQLKRILLGPDDHSTKEYGFKDRGVFL